MSSADKPLRPNINVDQPLRSGEALLNDKLGRQGFAESVVSTLHNVNATAGLVLSIEGAWGSGKTTTLAMVEELLSQTHEKEKPLIIHFNPWLIGDKDALLRQFLGKLANQLKLSDFAKDGKKAAKEIKAYAKAFDVLKLIPGAEPWASIIKSVVESVGDITNNIADYKTPDIEQQKTNVRVALQKFPRRIIVFIDDIDRLFPLEVFEMVRIIKAVGELPNIGYVLAWDPNYVSSALHSASVPQSATYLDKVVQIRMPLPRLSSSAKERLATEALNQLHPDALVSHFKNDEDRFPRLYLSGLGKLFEQPRDVTRIFNAVQTIEPALRGEVALSDIIGLAGLMVKAPDVFELLRKHPQWFVGAMPGDHPALQGKTEELIRTGHNPREMAYANTSNPVAVGNLVHFLFPLTANESDDFSFGNVVSAHGHIAAPDRLLVAMQLSASPTEVSFVLARNYLLHPEQRALISQKLTTQNCMEFLESLGDMAIHVSQSTVLDAPTLCLAIARLVDSPPYPAQPRNYMSWRQVKSNATQAINQIIHNLLTPEVGTSIATTVAQDELALSVAAEILTNSYLNERKEYRTDLECEQQAKTKNVEKFANNVMKAAKTGQLFSSAHPSFILRTLAELAPKKCPQVFSAIHGRDQSLDSFAQEILKYSYDSHKGQIYSFPQKQSVIEIYCSSAVLREFATNRLADTTLLNPAKAAWRSVLEGKDIYGVDGSEVS